VGSRVGFVVCDRVPAVPVSGALQKSREQAKEACRNKPRTRPECSPRGSRTHLRHSKEEPERAACFPKREGTISRHCSTSRPPKLLTGWGHPMCRQKSDPEVPGIIVLLRCNMKYPPLPIRGRGGGGVCGIGGSTGWSNSDIRSILKDEGEESGLGVS